MLVDLCGPEVTGIRISVAKRCNFGCFYCPDGSLSPVIHPRSAHGDEMAVDEVERIVRSLLHVVSLVEGRACVEALVALQADELGAARGGHDLGDFGLPAARLAFDEERFRELRGEEHGGREAAVGSVS